MEPRTPCPYQRMSNDGGCRKTKKTLDIKLMKLLGFLVRKSRKTCVCVTHRITPVSWPCGRYHENPPWPEMAQRHRAALDTSNKSNLWCSCGRSLLHGIAGAANMVRGDQLGACLLGLALGAVAQPLGHRDLHQHRLGLNVLVKQFLGRSFPLQ